VVYLTEHYQPIWAQFVANHDRGNVFQTVEMSELYRRHEILQPVTLLALEKHSGDVCAGLVGLLSVERAGILSPLSTRAIIQGGPLFRSDSVGKQAVQLLMDAFDKLVNREALFCEVWNLFDVQDHTVFNEMGYEWFDHLNYLIDLKQPIEDILASFSKSRRKNLRKSEQAGVVVNEVTKIEDIDIFYKLLQENYDRIRVPLVSKTLFKSAFDYLVPKQMAHFFLATHRGNEIGARVVLTYKNLVYDWYAGSRNNSRRLYPDELLVWEILQWSVKRDYECFNFGGAGKPDEEYGPREFKRRFGGELVNLGRYRKKYSSIKLKLAKLGYRAYRILPNRMTLHRENADY